MASPLAGCCHGHSGFCRTPAVALLYCTQDHSPHGQRDRHHPSHPELLTVALLGTLLSVILFALAFPRAPERARFMALPSRWWRSPLPECSRARPISLLEIGSMVGLAPSRQHGAVVTYAHVDEARWAALESTARPRFDGSVELDAGVVAALSRELACFEPGSGAPIWNCPATPAPEAVIGQ